MIKCPYCDEILEAGKGCKNLDTDYDINKMCQDLSDLIIESKCPNCYNMVYIRYIYDGLLLFKPELKEQK